MKLFNKGVIITDAEWIKIKDKLPVCDKNGCSGEILIYGPDINVVSGTCYWEKDKVFMDKIDTTFKLSDVTHWMLLPEPPDLNK